MIFSPASQRLNQQISSRAIDDFFYTILPVAHIDEPGARGGADTLLRVLIELIGKQNWRSLIERSKIREDAGPRA
jgi:hypothetical protein